MIDMNPMQKPLYYFNNIDNELKFLCRMDGEVISAIFPDRDEFTRVLKESIHYVMTTNDFNYSEYEAGKIGIIFAKDLDTADKAVLSDGFAKQHTPCFVDAGAVMMQIVEDETGEVQQQTTTDYGSGLFAGELQIKSVNAPSKPITGGSFEGKVTVRNVKEEKETHYYAVVQDHSFNSEFGTLYSQTDKNINIIAKFETTNSMMHRYKNNETIGKKVVKFTELCNTIENCKLLRENYIECRFDTVLPFNKSCRIIKLV